MLRDADSRHALLRSHGGECSGPCSCRTPTCTTSTATRWCCSRRRPTLRQLPARLHGKRWSASTRRRDALSKLADDVPRLLRKGSWTAAGLDLADMWDSKFDPVPGRNFMAGQEVLPPETVPFAHDDFDSEAQRLDICSPTLVTDEERPGCCLAGAQAQKVFVQRLKLSRRSASAAVSDGNASCDV